ncbi:hypothetical protein [Acinetobacter guillouiae]|uniref:hypothetical protein n=1 Tax=Acinetobacter guillouiae TaxID=106649 RepID=UPI003AF4EFA9
MILNLLIILALLIFITLVVIVIKNSKSSKDTSYPHQKEKNDSQSTYWTESFKVQSDEKRKDMIDAEKIGFLKLSLKDDGLIDLKHQLNLSNIQMDVLIQEAPKSLNRLIIDFGCVYDHDGDEDVRYVPVELSTESVTLNFDQAFFCCFYLADREIYSYNISDRWSDENATLEQAYKQFTQKLAILLKQGWKNYYLPHDARYAVSCEERLLKEQQHTILPNQSILSFEQFCNCLEGELHAIDLNLYLDGIYMSVFYDDAFSVSFEINKANNLLSYKSYCPEGLDDVNEIEAYKVKAKLLRYKAEQEARQHGFEIDESYIDPI